MFLLECDWATNKASTINDINMMREKWNFCTGVGFFIFLKLILAYKGEMVKGYTGGNTYVKGLFFPGHRYLYYFVAVFD